MPKFRRDDRGKQPGQPQWSLPPKSEGDAQKTGTSASTPVNGNTTRVGEGRKDSVDLYYELHGRGPHKVLLVMGFATSCKAWMPNVKELVAEHGDEFEVCIFDNRGCGRSSCPDSKFSTSIMASDALDLLDHLKWDKVHLVGISMGGMISQELSLLLLPQERLASLVLAVTHAGGLYATAPMAGVLGMMTSIFKKTADEKADILMKLIYSPKFLTEPCKYDSSKTWEEYCKQTYIERVRSEPQMTPKALAGHIRCVTTHHVSSKRLRLLREAQVPIVIVTGTIDALVRPKNSYLLAQELNPVEFHVWEGAGHAVNMECLDRFNEVIIRNFRRAVEGSGQRSPAEEEAADSLGSPSSASKPEQEVATETTEQQQEDDRPKEEDREAAVAAEVAL